MKLLRILCAVLLLAAAVSYAQSQETKVVGDVPFAFIVAGHTLPPGHYRVVQVNQVDLAIQGGHNHSVLVPAHSTKRSPRENSTKMVFHRYGDTYFLSEVWIEGDSNGKALYPSRAEREAAERGAEREIAVVRMGK